MEDPRTGPCSTARTWKGRGSRPAAGAGTTCATSASREADVERILGEVGKRDQDRHFRPRAARQLWLTEQLAWRGIVPVLGHTEANLEEARAAILAGARHVTHMYDATMGYKENPRGSAGDDAGHGDGGTVRTTR